MAWHHPTTRRRRRFGSLQPARRHGPPSFEYMNQVRYGEVAETPMRAKGRRCGLGKLSGQVWEVEPGKVEGGLDLRVDVDGDRRCGEHRVTRSLRHGSHRPEACAVWTDNLRLIQEEEVEGNFNTVASRSNCGRSGSAWPSSNFPNNRAGTALCWASVCLVKRRRCRASRSRVGLNAMRRMSHASTVRSSILRSDGYLDRRGGLCGGRVGGRPGRRRVLRFVPRDDLAHRPGHVVGRKQDPSVEADEAAPQRPAGGRGCRSRGSRRGSSPATHMTTVCLPGDVPADHLGALGTTAFPSDLRRRLSIPRGSPSAPRRTTGTAGAGRPLASHSRHPVASPRRGASGAAGLRVRCRRRRRPKHLLAQRSRIPVLPGRAAPAVARGRRGPQVEPRQRRQAWPVLPTRPAAPPLFVPRAGPMVSAAGGELGAPTGDRDGTGAGGELEGAGGAEPARSARGARRLPASRGTDVLAGRKPPQMRSTGRRTADPTVLTSLNLSAAGQWAASTDRHHSSISTCHATGQPSARSSPSSRPPMPENSEPIIHPRWAGGCRSLSTW